MLGMVVLTVIVCIVYLVIYTFIAQVFTTDVLFHEVLPNDTAAAVIVGVSVTALSLLAAFDLRNRSRRGLDRILVAGLILLLLQPVLQYSARAYIRAGLDVAQDGAEPAASLGAPDGTALRSHARAAVPGHSPIPFPRRPTLQ